MRQPPTRTPPTTRQYPAIRTPATADRMARRRCRRRPAGDDPDRLPAGAERRPRREEPRLARRGVRARRRHRVEPVRVGRRRQRGRHRRRRRLRSRRQQPGLAWPVQSGIEYRVPWIFDVIGAAESLVAKPEITSIADLEGKTVATPFASTAHFSLLAALDDAGVDRDRRRHHRRRARRHLRRVDAGRHRRRVRVEPEPGEADRRRGQRADHQRRPRRASARRRTTSPSCRTRSPTSSRPPSRLWPTQQDRAIQLINDDPDAAAEAVAIELEITPEEAAAQLGRPRVRHGRRAGRRPTTSAAGLAANLFAAAEFNKEQGTIDAVQPEDVYAAGVDDSFATVRRPGEHRRRSRRVDARRIRSARRRRSPRGGGGQALRIVGVSHDYPTSDGTLPALDGIDLDMAAGSFVCLVGPSGCGKTDPAPARRRLRRADRRAHRVRRRAVTGPGADRGVVFQHPTSLHAVARPCARTSSSDSRCAACTRRAAPRAPTAELARVGLTEFADRPVYELSGGMQQRMPDRPGAGQRSRHHADGRAARRARCADPRTPAGRAARDLAGRPAAACCSSPTASRKRSRSAPE